MNFAELACAGALARRRHARTMRHHPAPSTRSSSAAACRFSRGDLIVGDGDGIAIIRPDQLTGLVEHCRKRLAREEEVLAQVAAGRSTVDVLGMPPADAIGR
ncbi:MAG: hypothetical protein U1E46_12345 [Hyphomicrobiales bacterium]